MPSQSEPTGPSEVKSYLTKLILLIVFGLALMTGVAIWAWNTYAPKLDTARPLPGDTDSPVRPDPPLDPSPAAP